MWPNSPRRNQIWLTFLVASFGDSLKLVQLKGPVIKDTHGVRSRTNSPGRQQGGREGNQELLLEQVSQTCDLKGPWV